MVGLNNFTSNPIKHKKYLIFSDIIGVYKTPVTLKIHLHFDHI